MVMRCLLGGNGVPGAAEVTTQGTMTGETMSTPRTRPAWPGVITAAAAAVTLGALVICGQAHQAARQAVATPASAAIICPPPSGDGVMSKTGDPGC
jgi:hypothetical protein